MMVQLTRSLLLGGVLFAPMTVQAFPSFEMVEIDAEAGTGLAITVVDVNGDGKPDIVGVSADDVAWYENPGWERHIMAPTLRNSNVCVDFQDLDGDGVPEFAIGADWQFNNTDGGGALFLLEHDGDVKAPWKVRTLIEECPTLHRIRWMTLHGEPALIVAPLKGVGSTGPGFQERGAELFALVPPRDFFTGAWTRLTIDTSLHVLHNVWPVELGGKPRLLAASFEGITQFTPTDGGWEKQLLTSANPEPLPNSGAGEIKTGQWNVPGAARTVLATIEPWHGSQAVVYHPGEAGNYTRLVVDDTFKGGHAVYWADFDGDGVDELLAGYREKAGPEARPGLYIYQFQFPGEGEVTFTRHGLDEGGMATEDALAADINGDGRPDVAAYGRATHNIRLYLNRGQE